MGIYYKLKMNGEVVKKKYGRVIEAMDDARAEFRRNPKCPSASIYEVECKLAFTMSNKEFRGDE